MVSNGRVKDGVLNEQLQRINLAKNKKECNASEYACASTNHGPTDLTNLSVASRGAPRRPATSFRARESVRRRPPTRAESSPRGQEPDCFVINVCHTNILINQKKLTFDWFGSNIFQHLTICY